MAFDRSPGEGVAPLNKGLSRSDWGLRWEGPSGPHRSDSEVSGRKQSSAGAGVAKRSRMPHGGRHRKVTGGRQTKVARPSGPHRSDSEVSGRKQSSAGAGGAKRSRMPHQGRHRR